MQNKFFPAVTAWVRLYKSEHLSWKVCDTPLCHHLQFEIGIRDVTSGVTVVMLLMTHCPLCWPRGWDRLDPEQDMGLDHIVSPGWRSFSSQLESLNSVVSSDEFQRHWEPPASKRPRSLDICLDESCNLISTVRLISCYLFVIFIFSLGTLK